MEKGRSMNDFQVSHTLNIRDAIKKMDISGIGFVVVSDDKGEALGIITDGDFRRSVLKGVSLSENILQIANKNFLYLEDGYTDDEASLLFTNNGDIINLPVLRKNKLIRIISKYEFSKTSKDIARHNKISIPVVIMAGGKGVRLQPFTNVLPKPLIPIGEKTIIEIIMDEYFKYGCSDFFISVNYKANIIKAYFEYANNNFNINYINEDEPLGTAGALKYVENKINTSFFVSNCDIIVKDDYAKILEFHKKHDYTLTVVTSMQHVKIPYGVCEINEDEGLKRIIEKPEYDFLVNTGMYLLNPEALSYIPRAVFFNITDLIQELLSNNKKVGVYPVSENSYIDVGQWAEFKKAINILATETKTSF